MTVVTVSAIRPINIIDTKLDDTVNGQPPISIIDTKPTPDTDRVNLRRWLATIASFFFYYGMVKLALAVLLNYNNVVGQISCKFRFTLSVMHLFCLANRRIDNASFRYCKMLQTGAVLHCSGCDPRPPIRRFHSNNRLVRHRLFGADGGSTGGGHSQCRLVRALRVRGSARPRIKRDRHHCGCVSVELGSLQLRGTARSGLLCDGLRRSRLDVKSEHALYPISLYSAGR